MLTGPHHCCEPSARTTDRSASITPGCASCTDGRTCTACSEGRTLDTGRCVECPPNCSECLPGAPPLCVTCSDSFVLDLATDECVPESSVSVTLP